MMDGDKGQLFARSGLVDKHVRKSPGSGLRVFTFTKVLRCTSREGMGRFRNLLSAMRDIFHLDAIVMPICMGEWYHSSIMLPLLCFLFVAAESLPVIQERHRSNVIYIYI